MIRLFSTLLIASALFFFSSSAKADTERCWAKHPNEPASCAGQFKTIQDAQQEAMSSLGCDALNSNSTQYADSKGEFHQVAYYWCYPSGTKYAYYWLWDLPKPATDCKVPAGSVVESGYYPAGPASQGINPSTGKVLTWTESDGRHTPRSFPPSQANNACVKSCTAKFRISMNGTQVPYKTPVVKGVRQIYILGEYVSTGQYCQASTGTGSGDTPAPPGQVDPNEPHSCDPVKQDKITLNGKDICVNKSNGKEVNPTTGEDADGDKKSDKDLKKDKTPDGKDRTTETERIKNPDGSVTEKTTETVCDSAGNCKTSTSEKTTGKGDSESEPDKDNDLCKKYPNKKLCEEKSKYSDSGCPGIPACDGDAIQCGIAAEVKRRNCKDEKELQDAKQQLENSPEVARYNADKAANSNARGAAWGAAGSGSGGAGGSDTINIADKFNPDSFHAGQCNLQDIPLNLGPLGQTVLPVSILCQYASVISACVLILSGISCALIIYAGITRSA